MRNVHLLAVFCAASAVCALPACGGAATGGTGGSTTGGSGGGSTTSSSKAATTGSTSTATTGSTSTASTGTGGVTKVNGCDPATATDITATPTITFGGPTNMFLPACVSVKAGTMVTFKGIAPTDNFTLHPLAGGAAPPAIDASSPIKETKNAMTTASFPMPTAGSFGFFCENHFSGGMMGAIFVK